MTAIVGIQLKNAAVIAGDSRITYNDKPYAAKGIEKVITKDEYVIAFAGDDQAANIAQYLWQPPKVSRVMDSDKFMMSKVLPSLRKAMIDNGYNPDPADRDAGFDALVAFDGIIYEISHYYSFSRDDGGFYAIGGGGNLALGAVAMVAPKTIKDAEEVAIKAIQISANYNTTVGGETQVTVQRSRNVR